MTAHWAYVALCVIAGVTNLDLLLLWIATIAAEVQGKDYDGNKLLAWTVGAALLDVAVIVLAGMAP